MAQRSAAISRDTRPINGIIKEFFSPSMIRAGDTSAAAIMAFNAPTNPKTCVVIPQTKLKIPKNKMAW